MRSCSPAGMLNRAGLTLIELMAALTVLGFLAAVSTNAISLSAFRSAETQSVAQQLNLLLQQQRYSAIGNRITCGLLFRERQRRIVSVEPYQLDNRGRRAINGNPLQIPDNVTISVATNHLEFAADGTSPDGGRIILETPARTWILEIVAATGLTRMTENNN